MIIALDTETYKQDENGLLRPVLDATQFTLGAVKTSNGTTKTFTKPQEMYTWIIDQINTEKKRGHKTYIYAHNHQYDYYAYAKGNYTNELMNNIAFEPFLLIYDETGYFLDTYSFYKTKLAEIGELVGLPKQQMPETATSLMEITPYLQRDVEIVYKAIELLTTTIQELGFHPRKILTAGSLAMTSFRTYINGTPEKTTIEEITYNNGKYAYTGRVIPTKYETIIRPAYRGARTEAFKTGYFQEATYIDVNALYPYTMANMPFPNLKTETYANKPLENFTTNELLTNFTGVIRCTIQTPANNGKIPLLPIRWRSPGDGTPKERFTHGKRILTSTWTIPEIKAAIEHGYKLQEIHEGVFYQTSRLNPFTRYQKELYQKRLEATGPLKHTIKLLQNELYGKWGQNKKGKQTSFIHPENAKKLIQAGYKTVGRTGTTLIMQRPEQNYKPNYVNVIISTLTTAHARLHMQKQLEKIPKKDLLYIDTDSIMFTGNHLQKYDIGIGLGQFKIVEENKQGKILGEKKYYIGDQVKLSGLPKPKAKTKEEQNQLMKKILDEEKTVQATKMITYDEAIQRGNMELIGKFEPATFKVERSAKNEDQMPMEIEDNGNETYIY